MYKYKKPDNPERYKKMKKHFDNEMQKAKREKELMQPNRQETVIIQKRKRPLTLGETITIIIIAFPIIMLLCMQVIKLIYL